MQRWSRAAGVEPRLRRRLLHRGPRGAQACFSANGAPEVVNCKVVMDHATGTSKGFAFVEFSSPEDAKAAVATVNGKELEGKALRVEVQSKGKGKGDKGKGKGGDAWGGGWGGDWSGGGYGGGWGGGGGGWG